MPGPDKPCPGGDFLPTRGGFAVPAEDEDLMNPPRSFMRPLVLMMLALGVWSRADVGVGEVLPEGVRRTGPSELRIERKTIAEPVLARPVPQGVVDVNPPWLHVRVPLPDTKSALRAQKWHRRFYFKLSRDPQLKTDVLESGPKRWSFYNPFRKLEAGDWHWTYAVAPAETPDRPAWTNAVYTFRVERRRVQPRRSSDRRTRRSKPSASARTARWPCACARTSGA
jgi:hypothetical protein